MDSSLVATELPLELRDLPAWLEHHASSLDPGLAQGLVEVVAEAQDLLDGDRRVCLVHGDLNPKNLLVDPDSLEVCGLVDWEFAHLGSPYADLGNVLRFEQDPVLVDAVVSSYVAFMPAAPGDLLDRARAADLFALIELAARSEESSVVRGAREVLEERAGVRTAD